MSLRRIAAGAGAGGGVVWCHAVLCTSSYLTHPLADFPLGMAHLENRQGFPAMRYAGLVLPLVRIVGIAPRRCVIVSQIVRTIFVQYSAIFPRAPLANGRLSWAATTATALHSPRILHLALQIVSLEILWSCGQGSPRTPAVRY